MRYQAALQPDARRIDLQPAGWRTLPQRLGPLEPGRPQEVLRAPKGRASTSHRVLSGNAGCLVITATDPRRNHDRPVPQPPALRTVPAAALGPDPSPGARPAAPDPATARHRDRHRAGRRRRRRRARGTPSATASPAVDADGVRHGAARATSPPTARAASPRSPATAAGPGPAARAASPCRPTRTPTPTAVRRGGSDPSTPSQGSSTDTTSKASGSQLTGLVRIVSQMKYDGGVAAGTGMVLTSDGEVVTNHHVVAGATSVKVKVMSTGTTYTAKVVGTDTKDDVAVLQLVGASGLSTVTPDTDGIGVGDAVTAVGDANGTVGYLSAATGSVVADDQTITTQSEANVSRPAAQRAAADQLRRDQRRLRRGDVRRGRPGRGHDHRRVERQQRRRRLRGPDRQGAADRRRPGQRRREGALRLRLPGVPRDRPRGDRHHGAGRLQGTPAAAAGIAAGDTVTAIDGTPVRTSTALRGAVSAHSPGESVSVTWTDAAGAVAHRRASPWPRARWRSPQAGEDVSGACASRAGAAARAPGCRRSRTPRGAGARRSAGTTPRAGRW